MTDASSTWRVAVVGSGPAAFYTAEALFKSGGEGVAVDLFDRLPVPFGLASGGHLDPVQFAMGLLAFSLANSAVYAFNDAQDAEHRFEYGDDDNAATNAEQPGQHTGHAARGEHAGAEYQPFLHESIEALAAEFVRVEPEVLFDESRDEVVTVVVARVSPQLERQAAFLARRLV